MTLPSKPELDICSRCHENTVFEYDAVEGWTSICCTARGVQVDQEPDDA